MPRSKRPFLLAVAAVVLAVTAVGLHLFQPWRLFTTERVDEAPPAAAVRQDGAAPVQVTGTFVSHAHETDGSVEIHRLADGKTVLRLADLRTSDGPALRVWLSDQPVNRSSGGNLDDGEHIDLGGLKGNEGNQNYPVPAGTDLERFSTVTIWCERFSVSFGAAELNRTA
ncbi:DM13 domain-containing protein [Streptomyces lusitanus]|uniref:DM13 domain-containing protein n=1 Tax=Streptomyces lusitanus TaxID=68232 RepID=A0ABU3JWN9_9ACTN|nr:DM13 domain-containing protein [Streptomyces lusitanus]